MNTRNNKQTNSTQLCALSSLEQEITLFSKLSLLCHGVVLCCLIFNHSSPLAKGAIFSTHDKRQLFTVNLTTNKGRKCSDDTLKRNLPTLMFHQKNGCDFTQIWKLWASNYNRNVACHVECSNEIDILNGNIDCAVRMFRHCDALLLPQVLRIAQHRDETRRGNSSFCSLLVFRIGSCILFLGMYISSRSRIGDTTLIRGLNHGWNHTLITPLDETVIALLTFTLCGNLHIVLGVELRHQFGNILCFNVAFFLCSCCVWRHGLPIPKQ